MRVGDTVSDTDAFCFTYSHVDTVSVRNRISDANKHRITIRHANGDTNSISYGHPNEHTHNNGYAHHNANANTFF
jgi:hypothetical protein